MDEENFWINRYEKVKDIANRNVDTMRREDIVEAIALAFVYGEMLGQSAKRLSSAQRDAFLDGCKLASETLLPAWEKQKAKKLATKAGKGRALKYESCEKETIRLYLAGNWKSAPDAALDITPQIVKFSKKEKADLLPSTIKPLEWIRKYNKTQKSSPN
tara:strand:- start:11041 stop:11517 length:477 start_codon:yes stop_codon:yes gene_type:complete